LLHSDACALRAATYARAQSRGAPTSWGLLAEYAGLPGEQLSWLHPRQAAQFPREACQPRRAYRPADLASSTCRPVQPGWWV